MISLPILSNDSEKPRRRLPPWLKRPLPAGGAMNTTRRIIGSSGVATVCQEARCPNLTECWSKKTATFMILGNRCTRRCRFCAVETARPDPPEPDEPERLAEAVAELGLDHVVITAVSRDDLPDEGAGHFAACVEAIRERRPEATIEVLPADMHARPELIRTICEARPDIFNHNIETSERMTPMVRPQAGYRRSLDVLRRVKEHDPAMPTKSGLMVGIGESDDEIERTLADLRQAGCDIVTIGQYLQPTPRHIPVDRYLTPEQFEQLAELAYHLGFAGVASGPFVRSSYHAAEVFDRVREGIRQRP